ncbi:hypothetical protein HMPREF1868_01988 [Olsenella sp. DNF00959]|nr:hypothetical protein HMPREF1868_01988 [Olsenella sp. DNF00959]
MGDLFLSARCGQVLGPARVRVGTRGGNATPSNGATRPQLPFYTQKSGESNPGRGWRPVPVAAGPSPGLPYSW